MKKDEKDDDYLTDGEASHRMSGDDGRCGEQEEEQSEDTVGKTEVDEEKTGRFPCLLGDH